MSYPTLKQITQTQQTSFSVVLLAHSYYGDVGSYHEDTYQLYPLYLPIEKEFKNR